MTTNQYAFHHQRPRGPGLFREHGAPIGLVALFILFAVFGDTAYFVQLGKQIRDLAANALQWAVGAVVVVAIGRVLWPLIRPFVCVAIGLVTLWALYRVGIFTL